MDYFKLIYYGILMMIFLAIFIVYMRGKERQKTFIVQRIVEPNDDNLQVVHALDK